MSERIIRALTIAPGGAERQQSLQENPWDMRQFGHDVLAVLPFAIGGARPTLIPRAIPRVNPVAEALASEPLRVVPDAPVRTPGAPQGTRGFDIYQGKNPIGYSDIERIGPGEHKFHWLGAGNPNPLGAAGEHFPGALGPAGQRDVLQQIRKLLQEQNPGDPWPKMHQTYRESGANPGRWINDWKLPVVVGGVPMMAFPGTEDR